MTEPEIPMSGRLRRLSGILALVLSGMLILAALTGTGPLTMAKRTSASNEATQIMTACQAYAVEYGSLPPASENYRLIKILCGDNPRKIEFLSLKSSEVNPNGEMIDPWGTPFRIRFDSDGKVHAISAGPDKIFGTPDDVGY